MLNSALEYDQNFLVRNVRKISNSNIPESILSNHKQLFIYGILMFQVENINCETFISIDDYVLLLLDTN